MTPAARIAFNNRLLAFTLAAVFFTPGAALSEQRSVALTSNQTLKLKLIWEEGSGPAPSAPHHLTVGFTQSDEPSRVGVTRPAFRGYQESIYDEVVLAMAVGPGLFGDLEVNHAIQWKFKRNISFWHEGKQYIIDQSKLEKYPNLLSRLRQLTFSFARIDVTTFANQPLVKFRFGSEFFIVAGDGQEPYAPVPYSPAKWSDVVTFNEYLIKTDKESYQIWKELKSVHVMGVNFVNLKLPHEGLAAIAREFEKLEKTELEADKKTESLKKELEQTSALPAYRQGGELAEAYEAPGAEAFEEKEQGRVVARGVKSRSGRVVMPASRDVAEVVRPEGARLLSWRTWSSSSGLLSPSGRPVKIDGKTAFYDVKWDAAARRFRVLVDVEEVARPRLDVCSSRSEEYSSLAEATARMNFFVSNRERANEEERKREAAKRAEDERYRAEYRARHGRDPTPTLELGFGGFARPPCLLQKRRTVTLDANGRTLEESIIYVLSTSYGTPPKSPWASLR